MAPRLNPAGNPDALKFLQHLAAAAAVVDQSVLPAATRELIKIRASQINGCTYCTDMHIKDALKAGESQQRINLVAVWREATVFTDAERAALELAEEGTRIADTAGGVSNEVWERAAEHHTEEELVAMVAAITVINAFNRLNVIVQNPAG